jgi:effector-binding domain-containing protein
MEIIDGPAVVERPSQHTLGIRLTTPFRGMLGVRDQLLDELFGWLDGHQLADAGDSFLRLNVIDMDGPMDLEVGVITGSRYDGDDRVHPGEFPAGRYAALTYQNHARRANKTLLDWVSSEGLELDRHDEPEGDAFACRYEVYRTDPRSQPRKTQWVVELNLRLADGS